MDQFKFNWIALAIFVSGVSLWVATPEISPSVWTADFACRAMALSLACTVFLDIRRLRGGFVPVVTIAIRGCTLAGCLVVFSVEPEVPRALLGALDLPSLLFIAAASGFAVANTHPVVAGQRRTVHTPVEPGDAIGGECVDRVQLGS